VEPGDKKYRNATITFAVKKGQSIELKDLRAAIQATRLGKGTRSAVNYFELTVAGDVVVGEKETLLHVSGTTQQFVLQDDPKAKPEAGKKSAYERLRDALKKGEKAKSVTGRVQGWSGVWPATLNELAKQMEGDQKPVLVVTEFETVKP
jgi:hypothetical protein